MDAGLLLRFILTWALLGLGFMGIGGLLARLFKVTLRRLESWLLAFWSGWAFSIALMQIWSFFYPINDGIRLILGALAVIAWVLSTSPLPTLLTWRSKSLHPLSNLERGKANHWFDGGEVNVEAQHTQRITKRFSLWDVVPLIYMVGFVIWLANRSTLFPDSFDTALYHLQTIRWSFEYPAVPGLGNLHSRLAFSNGYFLYPALLNAGFWFERSYHITAGLLYAVMMAQIVTAGVNLLRGEWRLSRAYYVLFFPVIWFLFLTDHTVPSVTNDAPLFPLGIIVSGQLLRLMECDDLTEKQARYDVAVIVLLACVGVAIKFSFIALGGLAAAFALLYVLRRYTQTITAALALVGLSGAIAAFVLIPMMGRSVIMTGYPLYPLDVAAFHVDWRMPDFWPAREQNTIRGWAFGLPDGQTNPFADFGWFAEWSKSLIHSYYHIMTAFGLAGLGTTALIWSLLRRKWQSINLWWFAPIAAAGGGIIFWFFSAPLLRFVGALPWIIGLGMLVIGLTAAVHQVNWRKRILLVIVVVLCVPPLRLLLREPWIEPGPNDGLYYLPYVETEPLFTNYGVEVGIPVVYDMCFDSSLPCAPPPSPQLQYRSVDGDLRSGFRIGE